MVKDHMGKISSRRDDSHKGDYGKVLVVAGSKGMAGAAYLCSMGALRSGSGLVTCAVPRPLSAVLETKFTEVMTLSVSADAGGTGFGVKSLGDILDFAGKCDSVAIGPGLGDKPGVLKLVPELLNNIECPVVLDADGLNAMRGKVERIKKRKGPTVLTPHPGEAARLLEEDTRSVQDDRVGAAKRLVESTGAVVCLKGHGTVVAGQNSDIFINDSGNSGMATGGTGDVLTGIITSFIGQGLEPYGAAVSGVYLHGMAGDIAAQRKGPFSMIASDVLDSLHEAFSKAGI